MCQFLCNIVAWAIIAFIGIPLAVFLFNQPDFWLLVSVVVALVLLNRINPMIKQTD